MEWGICGLMGINHLMGGAFMGVMTYWMGHLYHLMGGTFISLNGWGVYHLMGRAFVT